MKATWRKALSTLMCAAPILLGTGNANAFGAFFYAKVKTESEVIAGLDEPTRQLIQSMPANIRVEAVKALAEAQPMIDKSVAKYLEDLDTRMADRIDQIGCVLSNTATDAIEKLKGPWGDKAPVSTLKNDYDTRKYFDPKKVENLAINYVDFVAALAKAGCGVYDPQAKAIVTDLRKIVRQRMLMWQQIRDYCTSPSECLEKRYAYTRQLIENADPRDLTFTGAKSAFEEVNGKPVSKVGSGFFSDRSLKWTLDENELVKLYVIDRSLDASQSLRAQNSKLYMRDASLALAKAEQALAVAKPKLSSTSTADNDAAIKSADEALSYRKEVTDNATAAVNAHDSQKVDGARVLARMGQIEADSIGIKESAQRFKELIARAAAEKHRLELENKVECKGKNGCVGGTISR